MIAMDVVYSMYGNSFCTREPCSGITLVRTGTWIPAGLKMRMETGIT